MGKSHNIQFIFHPKVYTHTHTTYTNYFKLTNTYSRWMTLSLPNTATAAGLIRFSISSASDHSVLLTVTLSTLPADEVIVLILILIQ